jgi:ABC-type multidrug transport system fused ATPase/permease subunit
VCAAIEELSRFKEVRTEASKKGKFQPIPEKNTIEFANVRLTRQEQESKFNFVLPENSVIQVVGDPVNFRWLSEMLRANIKPNSGLITFDKVDNSDIDLTSLRQSVRVIDRVTFLPMTIKDYLELFIPENPKTSRRQALTLMRLDEVVARLKLGSETLLSRSAWPLTQPQAIRLKLASVLLSRPSILVLGDIIDTVDYDVLEEFVEAMRQGNTTIIYYTRRQDVDCFDFQLNLQATQQSIIPVDKGSV